MRTMAYLPAANAFGSPLDYKIAVNPSVVTFVEPIEETNCCRIWFSQDHKVIVIGTLHQVVTELTVPSA